MNQTYLEWFEFDVKVVCILIATSTYEINIVVGMSKSVVFQIFDSFQYY